MAAQEGFLYEENATKELFKYGISDGITAGASHTRPDIMLLSENKQAGCELKTSATAAGSLVMKYYKGKWAYGDIKPGETEKLFLKEMGEKFHLLKEMNTSGSAGKNWRGKVPALQNDNTGKKIYVGAKDYASAYKIDIAQFSGPNEIKIEVPAKAISDYYNTKKCYYLNVGSHGFYLLNGSDPLKLNKRLQEIKQQKIPDFGASTKCIIRVRCQDKSGSYQFVMTLQFGTITKSPFNIAPIRSGSKSDIDLPKLKADPILLAFRKKS